MQMPTAQAKKQGTMLKSIGFDAAQKAYNSSVMAHNKINQTKEAKNQASLGSKDAAKVVSMRATNLAKKSRENINKAGDFIATPFVEAH